MLSFAQSQLDGSPAQLNLSRNTESFQNSSLPPNQMLNTNSPYDNEPTQNTHFSHHNYCNIGPVLGDVVTMSTDYLPPPPPENLLLYNHEQCNKVLNCSKFFYIKPILQYLLYARKFYLS